MASFTVPRFRIQDALGNAIVGGHIHFYETGTTTAKTTYSDAALTVPNTNPVVSGSDGWTPEVWMSADAYKVVIEDAAGAVLKTYDPYRPAKTDDSGVIAGTSSSSTAAVTGTNSSTGPGVKAVNTGAGHALWVEGDTSAPAKAALHVVPQDNFPSSPVAGDLVVSSRTGAITGYKNGEVRHVVELAPDSNASTAIDTTETLLSDAYVFAATGAVADGSVMRVQASLLVDAVVGALNITVHMRMNNTYLGTITITGAAANNRVSFEATIVFTSAATETFRCTSVYGSPAASYVNSGSATEDNATGPIIFLLSALRSGATSASVTVTQITGTMT